MQKAQRIIFISPHLDDAVLSCGGLIDRLSKSLPVEIWTIFCGRPLLPRTSRFAKWLLRTCKAKNASELIRLRKEEDKLASRTVHASQKHFPFLDCAFRVDRILRPLYENTCFVEPDRRDRDLVRLISKKLARHLKENDVVFCPLAIGNHVDHRITQEAVDRVSPDWLYFYEDVPYIMKNENKSSGDMPNLHKIETRLQSSSINSWRQAVCNYKSQLSMVDPDGKTLFSYIDKFHQVPFRFFSKNPVSYPIPLEIEF